MHIFKTIWTQPRAVLRDILNNNSLLVPLLLLYFGSVGMGLLSLADSQGMSFTSDLPADLQSDMAMEAFEIPVWFLLMSALFIGPIFYFISTVIYSFFTKLFGKWLFKGTGTFKDLLKVNAAAYLPFILAIPVMGIWLLVSPDSLLDMQYTGIFGLIVIFVLGLVTMVYFLILNLVGISEAHQFSKWKAFFTMIIPTILFVIFVVAILAIIVLVMFLIFASLAGV